MTATQDLRLAMIRELAHVCVCHIPAAFCQCHGSVEPASSDPEIIDAVSEYARARPTAHRVIRKPLEQ